MADLVAGGQRIDVADQLIGFAHIAADDADQGFVDLAALGEFHDRDVQAFLVDACRIRAEAAPADIDDMGGAGEEADQHAVVEGRA